MNGTIDDTQLRRQTLAKIVIEFRKEKKQVTRYTLQPELAKRGFDVSFATIYRDLTILNRDNTYVRDLAESNYSAYQEEIAESLDWVESQARTEYELTQNHVFLNVILKVQDLKMKHTNGENINISAALLGKKFNQLKQESKETQQEEYVIDVIKLANQRH
jgi:Fe2+ or Zn2+ uptake regulation protein